MSWLAIDEVLRIAGWSRRDVDAIVSTRSFFPPSYFRFPPHQEMIYAVRRWLGTDRPVRDLMVHCQLRGTLDIPAIFRSADFLRDNGFRPDIPLHFVNHHEAHALAALFFTDWNEALIYTADGVGDNVSYSVRTLRNGKLECHFGDDRWLLQRGPLRSSLAWAYGHATEACGFKMFRHEGKLTGLAAFGEPKLAEEITKHFWIDGDGMIAAKFKDDKAIRRVDARSLPRSFQGNDRRLDPSGDRRSDAAIGARLGRTEPQPSRSGCPAACSPMCGSTGCWPSNARSTRYSSFRRWATADCRSEPDCASCCSATDCPTWLKQRHRLDDVYLGYDYSHQIDKALRRCPDIRRLPGAPAEVATGLLVAGKVGAAYIGRMEFGPRALGARSILASPDDAAINDELDRRLDRSEFMPFAPYTSPHNK